MYDKKLMNNTKQYIRRTVSLSPQINELLTEGARKEFGGNISAYLAHIVLDYNKCKKCEKQNANSCKNEKTQ